MAEKTREVFAQVPPDYRDSKVEWLRMILPANSREGVSLFLYEVLSEPCLYDDWYETAEQAFSAAESGYGVARNAWQDREALRARGIDVIDER